MKSHIIKKKKKTLIKNSYGICCARYNQRSKKIEFLLVKKRVTFHYVDFILKSHFSYRLPQDEDKIINLLDQMTNDEKIDLLSFDYGKMWYRIWMVDPDFKKEEANISPEFYANYLECKNSFEKNFLMDKGHKLRELINRSKDCDCIWEFPKGRKSFPQEKELVTAIREFEEETGIPSLHYEILDFNQFIISHISSNVKYVNHFYLAFMPGPIEKTSVINWKLKKPVINYENKLQISEISDIVWMDIDKIEIVDNSKRIYKLAYTLNKILRKQYKIAKLSILHNSIAHSRIKALKSDFISSY